MKDNYYHMNNLNKILITYNFELKIRIVNLRKLEAE